MAGPVRYVGETRLRGEVGRTSGQLRLFASVVEEGSYLELTVDEVSPEPGVTLRPRGGIPMRVHLKNPTAWVRSRMAAGDC